MTQSRVMLVDDNPEILNLTTRMITPEFDVIDDCQEGSVFIKRIGTLNPDIVIIDVTLGDTNGFEVARQLRRLGCHAKVIFLSVNEDEEFIDAGLKLGASGYVIKRRLETDLVLALRAAEAGRVFVSSRK